MFALFGRYFEAVRPDVFASDLREKEAIILLYDGAELIGFSTLMRLQAALADRPITAFFSGDTIIDKAYWGSGTLARLWGRYVFDDAERLRRQDHRHGVYWLLISAGYKTYRFLPTFYRTFYPTFERATPPQLQTLMDALATAKFGHAYDPTSGIVRLPHATPLKVGVADLTPARLKDPHVAFFQARNPGHTQGDELVCLTEVSYDNLTPAGARMLGLRLSV